MTQREIYHNIIDLRSNGFSFKKISVKLGISESTASRWYAKGIPTKGKAGIIKMKSYRKTKAPKESNVSTVNKGLAKVSPKERVYKNAKKDPSNYRMISMMDSKNTMIEFHITDHRLSDLPKLRADWKSKQQEKLKNTSA